MMVSSTLFTLIFAFTFVSLMSIRIEGRKLMLSMNKVVPSRVSSLRMSIDNNQDSSQQNSKNDDNAKDAIVKRLAAMKPDSKGSYCSYYDFYVLPSDIEKKLTTIRDRKDTYDKSYFILAGPKEVDKTALVAKVFDNPGTMVQTIEYFFLIADTHEKIGTMKETLILAAKEKGSPVTIIIILSSEKPNVNEIRSVCKVLAMYATVVIVVSETNAAIEFAINQDPREKLIWVDSMTAKEADKFRTSIGITEEVYHTSSFFESVGTFPSQLFDLRRDLSLGETIKDAVKREVRYAERELRAFKLKSILKKLKNTDDNGVKVEDFGEEKYHGVLLSSPIEVAEYMGKVLMYHIPSGEYRFTSNVYKTALDNFKDKDFDSLD